MDHTELKSLWHINIPCLDKVKQAEGTLSSHVKPLQYVAPNKRGFETSFPHPRGQQELCHAWAGQHPPGPQGTLAAWPRALHHATGRVKATGEGTLGREDK